MQGGRRDLTGLVKVEAEELRETRRVRIHVRPAVAKGLEDSEERVQLLDSQNLQAVTSHVEHSSRSP